MHYQASNVLKVIETYIYTTNELTIIGTGFCISLKSVIQTCRNSFIS